MFLRARVPRSSTRDLRLQKTQTNYNLHLSVLLFDFEGKNAKIAKARVRFEDYLQYKPEHRYSELRAKKGIGSK